MISRRRSGSTLVEPFALGLHAVHMAEITTGDEVFIVGAGGVGRTALMWALEQGADRMTVVDPAPKDVNWRRLRAAAQSVTPACSD